VLITLFKKKETQKVNKNWRHLSLLKCVKIAMRHLLTTTNTILHVCKIKRHHKIIIMGLAAKIFDPIITTKSPTQPQNIT
jgi:hypothetical protein